ncbi:MAG: acetyl-CoA carboxylase biotin carboxyl carrier protein subunit [Peptococcaceae bacterium]|nr:MAG: acetyl-CoA carboxylase biotin carboxyl carrier protein subunit [Peptococcaceae bacterium]
MEKYRVTINNRSYEAIVEVIESDREKEPGYSPVKPPPVRPAGVTAGKDSGRTGAVGSDGKDAVAPLPGTVSTIKVAPGDGVAQGQILLVLEAMKMENEVLAEHAGKVEKIHISVGDNVKRGELLVSIK